MTAKLNLDHALRAVQILNGDKPFELRIEQAPPAGEKKGQVIAEWPKGEAELRKLLIHHDKACAKSIWCSFQPLNGRRKGFVTNEDVKRRDWFFIDVARTDTENPATLQELAEAKKVFDAVLAFLAAQSITPRLVGLSGNGWHAYLPLDGWPNDEAHADLAKSFLKFLADKFNSENGKIDIGICNVGRVAKLFGTVNRKGVESEGRPYRTAEIHTEDLKAPANSVFFLRFWWTRPGSNRRPPRCERGES